MGSQDDINVGHMTFPGTSYNFCNFLVEIPTFKVVLSPSKIYFVCFNDSLSKMMKNAFYFILKAVFILKIFKFLSSLFGHPEKTV